MSGAKPYFDSFYLLINDSIFWAFEHPTLPTLPKRFQRSELGVIVRGISPKGAPGSYRGKDTIDFSLLMVHKLNVIAHDYSFDGVWVYCSRSIYESVPNDNSLFVHVSESRP